ncbi:glycine zipper 2TM domain-containing protein [Sphingobium sp. WCS2017Hpa-17]|uniref:glycine zipper 2TM domain-containing protein n=1 Tax=Sphingobium sp. WCS2017Hpa-17 TaxID=3073638 RepID=UPI00288A9B51|nr:glycine zipper 2TM domain-containing protein [Sphingobium sp. WCS2017Hpa-17]
MIFSLKRAIAALSLGAMALTGIAATPAAAQSRRDVREHRRDVRDARKDYRRDVRDARQDHRRDVRSANRDLRNDRRDWRQDRRNDYRRPGRPVYSYDWNRPDPRYGRGYQANRYYRGGYAPIRVDRRTRIYRGNDNRYYCRRSDGTTGLIVGAALGGLLGNQIAQGESNLLGTLIGGGAGALLGREIDRGGVSCR